MMVEFQVTFFTLLNHLESQTRVDSSCKSVHMVLPINPTLEVDGAQRSEVRAQETCHLGQASETSAE